MLGTEIQTKAERYIDADISDNSILDGIEEFLNWLGNKGYVEGTILLDVEEDTFYTLPYNIIRITKIEDPEEDEFYYNYIVDGDKIRFGDEGTYRIFAKKHPSISALADSLGLHLMLEGATLKYVKGYCKLEIDDTSQDGARLVTEAKEDATRAYQILKRNQKEPSTVKVIRHAQ